MLIEALEARLPLLRATTTDTVNLPEVLQHLAPHLKFSTFNAGLGGKTSLKGTAEVFVTMDAQVQMTSDWYAQLAEQGMTVLLINVEDESGLALNVGEIPVPLDLMETLLGEVMDTSAEVQKLLPSFRGLTLKTASEVIRMVMTQDKCLSVASVLRVRSQMVGKLKGLSLVETATQCYIPNKLLAAWVKNEKPYFEGASDPRLIPRGLLFDGVAGTGKTQGAKYIAREFGVPLYRLDLASSLAKWVGESEANFGRVLSMLDQEEPCVFLIDEVEKLFEAGSEDAGTTSRILSQLLWWAQEHTSRIITVMTTNKRDVLPAELYRNGRIDRVMVFLPLSGKDILELAAAVCTSLKVPLTTAMKSSITAEAKSLTPAAITQLVFDEVKKTKKCLGD